jgi:hypothetical protein
MAQLPRHFSFYTHETEGASAFGVLDVLVFAGGLLRDQPRETVRFVEFGSGNNMDGFS